MNKPTDSKKRKKKVRAKLDGRGVNIIDVSDEWLIAMTDKDALHLCDSLNRLRPRIERRLGIQNP